MSVVLFVAELGAGFGHVRRLLPLADAAAAAGRHPTFVVGNPDEVAPLIEERRFALLRAPAAGERVRLGPPRGAVAASFGDILGAAGFADATYLAAMVAAWDAFLARTSPCAIVGEFSPFLTAATFGGEIPVLVVGHGFGLPPPHLTRFPLLREGEALYDERMLLDNVGAVCRTRGRHFPTRLPQILEGTAHAVTGLAVLDPYARERRHPVAGPPVIEARLGPAPTDDLFAYLGGEAPSTLGVLEALAASGARGRAFIRQGQGAHRRALAGSAIRYLERPQPIRQALERARAVVHHGSMSTAEEALFAGRPQVIVPLFLEHLLTARALSFLGVAHIARSPRNAADVVRALDASLADDSARRACEVASGLWEKAAPAANLPARLLARILPATSPAAFAHR